MSSKTYEQKVTRLVQEATGRAYQGCLNIVRKHEAAHPEHMTKEERALAIVNTMKPENSGVDE